MKHDVHDTTTTAQHEAATMLERTEAYLTGALLPFWLERLLDKECGGFLA